MKHLFFSLLFCLAAMSATAQKINYGEVRLVHPEIPDSLHRLDLSIEKIQNEIDRRQALRAKDYYGGRDKTLDSLSSMKWHVYSKRLQLLRQHNEELGIDIHLQNAGKYVRRGYTLELTSLAFSVVSGICLGSGYGHDKDGMKVVGYVAGAVALGNIIGAYVCHFKSGQELKLAGNSVTYSF